MKIQNTIVAFLLFTAFGIAQNGINYKALIKDVNGNVVENTTVQIQFTIIEDINDVYSETHSSTTDTNGILIVNIGEGSTTLGDFSSINWSEENHALNVQIDTGSGLIDIGTTPFMSIPFAKHANTATTATNVTGLEAIDEGNGLGWRLKDYNASNYGAIGLNAVDLSIATTDIVPNLGATGSFSFASGINTLAIGNYSTAMGINAVAIGSNATAIGLGTRAEASSSIAIGRNNIGGGSSNSWVATDPLFEIGNSLGGGGLSSNALTVLKNGEHIIDSDAVGLRVNSSSDAITILDPGGNGVFVNTPLNNGLAVYNANNNGVFVFNASDYGGAFNGGASGIFARSTINTNPDIVLGAVNGTNTGDDGIITTDPAQVGSDMYLRSYDAVIVQLDYNNDEAGHFIIRNGNGTDVFQVNESGNVSVNGSVVHSSDARLKKDIEDISYGLDEILKLKPKEYHWKNSTNAKTSLGLIAQEVQPIINNIVTVTQDKTQTLGISYTELIPVLIKAVQEQQVIIDTLKNINLQQGKMIKEQGEGLLTSKVNYETLLSRIEILESYISN